MLKFRLHIRADGVTALLLWLAVIASAQAGTPEVVFQAFWGDQPNEIGLINKPEMEVSGPLSFCTDGQNVFVLDSVHQRIIKSDSSGKSSMLAAKLAGWGVCADGAGGVFVQDNDRITHIDTQGAAQQQFTLGTKKASSPKIIQGYGVEMFVDADGALSVRTLNQAVQRVPGAKGVRAAAPSPPFQYAIKRMSGNQVRILGCDADGKALVSVPIRLDDGQPGAVLFKGTDATGNLYVELENLKGNKVGLEVHRYAPSGERLALFRLSNDYFTTVYKKTDVAPDGSVYQLFAAPDGVSILRYGKEAAK